jgi:hypothetical protein
LKGLLGVHAYTDIRTIGIVVVIGSFT